MSFKITVNGKALECGGRTRLGDILKTAGVGEFACGGHGKCGKCRIKVSGAVTPPAERELELLSEEELRSGVRLACLTEAFGDAEVFAGITEKNTVLTRSASFDAAPEPAFSRFGAAFDVGTTTVAAKLYGADGKCLASADAMNPQRVFGADVVTRIEAALRGEARALAETIRKTLAELITELSDKAGITPADIDGAVITGNTVMLHLLTEQDTEPLSHAPFKAARLFGEELAASDLGLGEISGGVYLPPCASAFVGADTVCALLSSGAYGEDKTELLADIGTNGEIVLNVKGSLLCCSTAAGPAFEGAGISCGTSGREGAIDKVTVKNGAIEAHVIGGAAPSGICGSGIVDAVACFLDLGLIDETGFAEDAPLEVAPSVTVTQKDIRAVQLAKSAIHAGIRTLMVKAGLECPDIDTLYIAGGFGNYLDVKNAGKIGLIPAELTGKVNAVGNAALSGASALLLSKPLRAFCKDLAAKMTAVDLASDPVFTEEYMDKMMF